MPQLGLLLSILTRLRRFGLWKIDDPAVISWVNPDPYNPIVQALTRLTEPVLRPLRKLAPPHKIGVDLSPLIAILIILFLEYALVANLKQFAYGLR